MKRVELKRIAEALWKGNSPDEKTAFANQSTVPDNGSFSKNFEADDIKSTKEFKEDEDEKSDGPMSIPRKICFVLSFNAWILYFLVLAWLIPCRDIKCGVSSYPDVVQRNLSSIWLFSNVETLNMKKLPSLAIFGYGNGTEWKLAALATYDGTFEWNNSVSFIPRNVQCNFENLFDVNGDGIPDCLLSGNHDIYAFNASNGHVFWNQSIESEKGGILSQFHLASTRNNDEAYLITAWGDELVTLNAHNGTIVSETKLPCSASYSFIFKIVSNKIDKDFSLWTMVCDSDDKVEAWSFEEQEVLKRGKSENKTNDSEFNLLFSGSNSDGSIDLGCDVTPVPGGPLLISWSNRVAMVTPEATAWERHFTEPQSVAAIKVGHFSNFDELHVAVAVRNATDTILYMLEINNGSIVDAITLPDRRVKSMEMVAHDYDVLVLQSDFSNYTSPPIHNNMTDPVPSEQTNFVLVDYSNGAFKTKDIVTTYKATASAVNVQTSGQTDLLIFITQDGMLSYERHVLHDIDTKENFLCIGAINGHHYSFET